MNEPGLREALFFESLASSPDASFAVDPDGQIVFWNRAIERLLAWESREVMGRHCWDVLCGLDVFRNRYCADRCALVRMAEAKESIHPFHVTVKRRDGVGVEVSVAVLSVLFDGSQRAVLLHTLHPVGPRRSEPLSTAMPDPAATAPGEKWAPPRAEPLTQREIEILGMLAAGHSTGEIARRLFISNVTVRNHVQHVLEKLGVHSKADAVAFAFRHRLV